MTAGACTADRTPLLGHAANYLKALHDQSMRVDSTKLSRKLTRFPRSRRFVKRGLIQRHLYQSHGRGRPWCWHHCKRQGSCACSDRMQSLIQGCP